MEIVTLQQVTQIALDIPRFIEYSLVLFLVGFVIGKIIRKWGRNMLIMFLKIIAVGLGVMWITAELREFLNIEKDYYPTGEPVIKEDASAYFEKEVYEAVKPYMDEYLYY